MCVYQEGERLKMRSGSDGGGGRFNATQINCLKKGHARPRLFVVYFSFVLNDLG
jgi:hypothetical protein